MFNLNIPTTQSLLGVDTGGVCTTPKTPEILNSLIAMTNPLDNYTFAIVSQQPQQSQTQIINNQQAQQQHQQQQQQQQQQSANQQQQQHQQTQSLTQMINNHQIISQDSSHSSCSGSPLDSPAGTNTTPSVQQTCSQLIKAGLKLSIQSKRKMSSGDSSSGNEQPNSKNSRKSLTGDTSEEDTECRKSPKTGLTPEDEDRRRRRRERNKIAATKCRMKKRERTMNLVSESEQLETQNKDLKSQVQNLESERRKLFEMLKSHGGKCVRPGGYHPPAHLCQSPACRYLSKLEMNESCNNDQHQQMMDQQQQQQQQQQCRTAIPPMNTIKYGRNGLRNHQNHMNNGNTNGGGGLGIGDSGGGDDLSSVCNPQNPLSILTAIQNSAGDLSGTPNDLLTAGYCKPSPTPQEIGYLDSPTHDISNCLSTHLTSGILPQHQHLQTVILKSDYIPNCENSNGGTTVDTTTDFVLKNELVDAQSPYTTVQSADRFLFESECESFDIKHNNNNNNNNNSTNNNNSSSNNNNIDFHPQLSTTPTGCQAYDNLLIKNDFLSDNTELLTPFGDGTETEFTDLDSGVTGYSHITNGGCLA